MRLARHENPKESKLMKFINLAGTAIMLNLIFLVACIPVVTIGPAFSGLYSGVRYMIRGDGAIRGFRDGFKTNPLRTVPAGIVMMAAVVYFVINVNAAYNYAMDLGDYVPLIMYGVLAMPVLMIFAAMWPLNIYIDYSAMDWLRNSVNLVVKAPHWVLLSAVVTWAPVVLFFWMPILFWAVAIIFIAAWFSMASFASTLFLKDALVDLKKIYLEQEEEEE
jgi:uncharacterized membrane protein YesL